MDNDSVKARQRHRSLAEAVQSHHEIQGAFHYDLVSFLDDFYLDKNHISRRARLEDEPILTGEPEFDANIGAIAEHLCRRWKLGAAPVWTEDPARFLKRPLFLCEERMKPICLVESPSAFRRRFIFTELEPLRRARMPKDAAWWYAEEIRNGLKPSPGDIEPMDDRESVELDGTAASVKVV